MDKRAIVFEPHDDDFIIGMGGSGLYLLENGWDITSVLMTDGRHGSEQMSPEETQKVRCEEKSEEIDLLGIECIRLEVEDGTLQEVYNTNKRDDVIDQLEDIFERVDPAVVFYPSPDEGHPDHRATSRFVKYLLGRLETQPVECQYVVWQMPFLEAGDVDDIASVVKVPVDRVYDDKLKAIQMHTSQEQEGRYSDMINHFNAYLSYLYSSYQEKEDGRVEVLAFPRQEAQYASLLQDIPHEDVTELTHGRSGENIRADA